MLVSMSEQTPVNFIDTPTAMETCCRKWRQRPWLAVDTEFIREKTYYPQLCLIQLSDGVTSACIDPLAIADLAPLFDLLYDPAMVKVFHSAYQDLEIFFLLRGSLPVPVFDTQLAAPLLGHGEQIGYANLVHAILDVRLHKAHSRTDWSRRPLSPPQLRYAGDDVLYLGRIYPRMLADLESSGRNEWLRESHAKLVDPEQYRQTPERAWRRLRGIDRLDARQQSAVRRLAAWREATAQAENRPRGWILSDDILLVLARMLPQVPEDLERVRNLPEAVRRRHGATLLQHIAAALETPLPTGGEQVAEERKGLSEEQEAVVDGLMAVLRLCAADHGVHPSALASRRDLERLVLGERDLELLQGWRRPIVGDRLREFAAGRRALVVRDGILAMEPA